MNMVKTNELLEKELFEKVKKLFNLEITHFVIAKDINDSECDKYGTMERDEAKDFPEGDVICYLKNPEDVIHEGIHAFFAERIRKLMKDLGEEEFWSREEETMGDDNIEEVVARFIEYNIQNKEFNLCTEEVQKKIRYMIEKEEKVFYKDIETMKKIRRLYFSVYENRCLCPKDSAIYNDTRNSINPVIVYNILAKYVSIPLLI